jgi:Cu-Zn family superoxide dismutase
MHPQRTIWLAVAAALAAAPLAAQDTTLTRSGGDTARSDTSGTGAGTDTAAVRPTIDSTRMDTSGVETGAVDTNRRDSTRPDTPPADTTTIDSARGYEAGVVRSGATSSRTGAYSAAVRPTAGVTFLNRDGRQVGTGTLTQTDRGVLITANLSGLPAGEHAFHVHQTGKCDAPSFESAGDHYAPAKRQHGFLANGGPHAGDMTNVQVVGSTVNVQEFNPFVTLSGGEAPLLDQDGSALVLHAKADDYRSQPSGDAGDRIACAIVQSTGAESR